jgi:hypothetical protein
VPSAAKPCVFIIINSFPQAEVPTAGLWGVWVRRSEAACQAIPGGAGEARLGCPLKVAVQEAREKLAGWDGASMRTAGPQTPQMPRTASPPAAQRLARK